MSQTHSARSWNAKFEEKKKYLSDYITDKCNSKETIKQRTTRGYAVMSQMTSLLNDIPLGKRRIQMGLTLRNTWFLNGCLINSEVWTGYSENDLKELEIIDNKILKKLNTSNTQISDTPKHTLKVSSSPTKCAQFCST